MPINGLASTLFSIAMLAALALIGFGVRFVLMPDTRKHGGLMLLVGVILIANVLIWTV